ncbi:TPA: hypothetical protein N0F65_001738 [Lagenidium giganteum]|uniref:SGNH hydrolase-type esterase domain-containing protein n=1 Tax=Lagenidium giganteum TaxID=4803 RepID=A0AAV2Z5M2_9STRA|nr:TPA: hypothetical protein N0F65_001738 [Lagenidium giganteum]
MLIGRKQLTAVARRWHPRATTATRAMTSTPRPRPTFLLLGDSLTEFAADPAQQGWVCRLQHEYVRTADLVNRGLSGYNTRWFLDVAWPVISQELKTKWSPVLVTLWFGANDAALPSGVDAGEYVPLDEYARNIESIITKMLEAAPNAHVIVLTPPPVDDAVRLTLVTDSALLDRSDAHVKDYAARCLEIAQRFQSTARVTGIDMRKVVQDAAARSDQSFASLFCDGLHFSDAGNELVTQELLATIRTVVPHLAPERLVWQLPDWETLCVKTRAMTSSPPPRRPTFLLLGDSLTQFAANPEQQGWMCLLQHDYVRSVDWVNRGLSGYNTRWFLDVAWPVILQELKTQWSPVLVTLWLGANDAALPSGSAAGQHVPLDEFERNIDAIITKTLEAAPNAHLIVLTAPPVDDAARSALLTNGELLDRSDASVNKYAARCLEVVQRFKSTSRVTGVDMHKVVHDAAAGSDKGVASLLCDGLHFSDAGNKLVAQELLATIRTAVPNLAPECLAWQFPDWKTMLAPTK